MRIIECEQGTPEWFKARAGIPTASEFHTVMAKGRGSEPSVTRRKYLCQLAGEIITGEIVEGFSNKHTEDGKAKEPDARNWYIFDSDTEVQQVGFCRHDTIDTGFSPDGLVGLNGMVEIKRKIPALHIECLLAGVLPNEHRHQVQGGLWISGREWCDFVSYWPKLRPFKLRVFRDEPFIAEIAVAVRQFNDELAELVRKLQ